MDRSVITAIGDVHYSSAETQAYAFGLDPVFIDNIRQERMELTSQYPIIEGIRNLGFAVAEAVRGSNVTPNAQGISGMSGPEGGRA